MSDAVSLALWATNMACAPHDARAFVDLAADQIEQASAAGADLLMMPEHVSEALLTYAPRNLPETQETAWMAEEMGLVLPALRELAVSRRIAVLAGTSAHAIGGGRFRNRAHLLLPDGRVHVQDKLVPTPDENDAESWLLEPGDRIEIATWRGLWLAVVICLDIEQPALAARLQAADLDLVLVPSDTAHRSGYTRVFTCAKARAIELFTTVAAVGGIGPVPLDLPRPNCSGAAVFVPCEAALVQTGVLAEIEPSNTADGPGPLLTVKDVPIGLIRRLRVDGAEVWPGPWSGEHVAIENAR